MKICFGQLVNLIAILTIGSCQSHEQKIESAFEVFRNNRLMTADSVAFVQSVVPEKEMQITDQSVTLSPWIFYKNEATMKIESNDKELQKIKLLADLTVGMFKKVTLLEDDNNKLKTRLNESEEGDADQVEEFKQKMSEDLDKIGREIELLKQKYNERL